MLSSLTLSIIKLNIIAKSNTFEFRFINDSSGFFG